ncbi:thiamine phosphate synthase [Mucilaginibacter sp. KACC 22063]|uniref:thiamine phosphate synthase n=1 Tax=Mucilaginibacter sp. KACC 22063 TaxID=3025666 RepID=UPI0023668E9A|nr:thiamine phosphate synthase [Mucilaginibacter sp. KACC 22063]WDF57372.1 thiamine phosphate synthase [Mucilaginibacter sp. KACC 22063]
MSNKQMITGGVYLVIDPGMESSLLLSKLSDALKGGLQAVQIWDHWLTGADKKLFIHAVAKLCSVYNVPLLIDNNWQLMMESPELDGVHFDGIPEDYDLIRNKVEKDFIAGITCSGDLDIVKWANEKRLNYVSFCAMFPSPSAGSCDIVMPSTVRQAKTMTDLPLFVSGGITPENTADLRKLITFDGVAVISGIMTADDPYLKVKQYKNALTG